jgi:hypothetical protein
MQLLGSNGPLPDVEADIEVNQSAGTHIIPQVGAASDGEFVVAWAKAPGTIRARRFASDGSALSEEITEISPPIGSTFPDVQVADDHSFVVSWGGTGTFLRFYTANDQPTTTALRLPIPFGDGASSLGLDQTGNVVMVSRSTLSGSPEVIAQRFSTNGEGLEEAFVVNSLPSNSQSPRVAVQPTGEFAVTWYSCCSSSEQPVWFRLYELGSL